MLFSAYPWLRFEGAFYLFSWRGYGILGFWGFGVVLDLEVLRVESLGSASEDRRDEDVVVIM